MCMHCLGSLAKTALCGLYIDFDRQKGTYNAEGINALCDALKGNNTLTSLKCTSQLESQPTVNSL